jgi:hypothetical protein
VGSRFSWLGARGGLVAPGVGFCSCGWGFVLCGPESAPSGLLLFRAGKITLSKGL